MAELPQGTVVLGRYVLERKIGEGGMGAVYAARHASLGHRVAVKTLTLGGDELAERRFEREARLMAMVKHPNVVSVIDVGMADADTPCIVMEFVQGTSLEDVLAARGALPWQEAGTVLLGLLAGVGAVHAHGVAHRDLKPSNVVLVDGRLETPKLIDFGIARSLEAKGAIGALTQAGVVIGTPAYMAPEQLVGGPTDLRADLYALALIWYEMVTRRVLFEGDTFADLLRRVRMHAPAPEAPPGMPEVPDAVSDVILSALSTDPDDRPQDARSFAARLRSATRLGTAREAIPPRPRVEPSPPAAASAATPGHMGRVRWLVVAVLPPSRLALPEERRWLAEAAGARAKGYAMGAQVWIAVSQGTASEESATREAEGFGQKVRARFGPTASARHGVVAHDFALTVAQLTGLKPLPAELRALVDAAMKG